MKTINRCIIYISILACLCLSLGGCGKKDYAGYYIYDSGDMELSSNIAMEVDKDGTVIYMVSENDASTNVNQIWAVSHKGTIEPEENAGLVYFTTQCYEFHHFEDEDSSLAKYCPAKLTISDDGKRAYFSADSDEWVTDVFEIVSEKEFIEFTGKTSPEHNKRFIEWMGDRFMTEAEYENQDWSD